MFIPAYMCAYKMSSTRICAVLMYVWVCARDIFHTRRSVNPNGNSQEHGQELLQLRAYSYILAKRREKCNVLNADKMIIVY